MRKKERKKGESRKKTRTSVFEVMDEPEMLESVYKKGDTVNLKELLFSPSRDFLIKSNSSSELVTAEQLEGKVIVLHFMLIQPEERWRWTNTAHLADVYAELLSDAHPRPFEVVFVPILDDGYYDDYGLSNWDKILVQRRHFTEVFSTMPWLAIPVLDTHACRSLADSFVASKTSGYLPYSVVISPTGVVCQSNALPLIRAYGAAAYPFTDKEIEFLQMDDNIIRNQPSLEALLVTPKRDYVINNRGDKVNVCDLKDKVVALYFYEDGYTDNDLTTFLEKAYRQCAREEMGFEVVLVYIYDSPNTFGCMDIDSFAKRFETMPWLALPFKDMSCKRALRVFKYPIELGGPEPDPSLVIIGPHGNFVERLGASVLMNFGVKAYPFTRQRAYMLQVERVKNLKLKMLFGREAVFVQCWDDSTFQEVSFSDIDVRKPIIVFSVPSNHIDYMEFQMKLRQKYLVNKWSCNEFEVIQIGGWDGEIVPWLKMERSYSWFDKAYKNVDKRFSDVLHDKGYGVFVFDREGKVARATINPGIFDFEADDFPFCGARLEEEVVYDLNVTCNWIFS